MQVLDTCVYHMYNGRGYAGRLDHVFIIRLYGRGYAGRLDTCVYHMYLPMVGECYSYVTRPCFHVIW